MITSDKEVVFQLFKHEESLNGYYHLVQKRLHGTELKRSYVGLKNFHVQEALRLNLPIMVHLCPNVSLNGTSDTKSKNLRACKYSDQTEVMVIRPENFFKFRTTNMQESKSRDKNGNLRVFGQEGYQVWHYTWYPDYIEGKGIIKRNPSTEQLGLF